MRKKLLDFTKFHWLPLIIILLVSIPILLPYIHSGYFPTHDGEWAVVRLSEMFRELRDHQLPARFSEYLNNGYGYPLFNFAYPGPYYLGIPFVLVKLGFVNSIKLLFVLGVVIGGIGMYAASAKLWKSRLAGLVSALFYLYLPYHLVDLFVRGSIGETLAFAVISWIILGALLIKEKKRSYSWMGLTALLIGLLVLVHNIMALVFAPIILAFMLTQLFPYRWRLAVEYIITVLLGFGVAAFFWVPALVEKHLILLSKIPIADRSLYFVSLKQFIFPSWGYGVPTAGNPFTYQLGWPLLIALILSVGVLYTVTIKHSKVVLAILLLVWLVYTLMLFSFTSPIWQALPLLKEINYPWTLLGPIGFLSSILVGSIATHKRLKFIGLGLAVISIIVFLPYAKPEQYVDRGEGFYATNTATTTSSNELMPLWVKEFPQSLPDSKVVVKQGKADISDIVSTSRKIAARLVVQSPSVIRLNTIYFPGWVIRLNGHTVPISYHNKDGVMEIVVPNGNWQLSATLTETNDQLTSDMVSLLSIVGAVILIAYGVIQYGHSKKIKQ